MVPIKVSQRFSLLFACGISACYGKCLMQRIVHTYDIVIKICKVKGFIIDTIERLFKLIDYDRT